VTVESGRQSRYMPREQGKTMEKFTTLTGIAAHLPMINVDTDMIIPKQYLKTIARTGLGEGLFAELRYDEAGERLPDFVLHNHPYTEAQILIAGDNFGCGSSREHAPWALLDFGFRCIVAPSFADIFYNNCFKNGILPVVLPQSEIDKLIDDASRGANAVMTVDLEAQEIRGPDGGSIPFDVDPHRKRCLMEGLDDIALTMEKADAIEAFEQETGTSRPWA
jgi:3-isopropylmalate/(R)-2-methylmalate dehydratase small subunit